MKNRHLTEEDCISPKGQKNKCIYCHCSETEPYYYNQE